MKTQKVIEVSESSNIIIGKVKEGYFMTEKEIQEFHDKVFKAGKDFIKNAISK